MSRPTSGFYMSIARTPLIWLVILAPLGLVMLMSFGVQRMQAQHRCRWSSGSMRG